VRDGAFGETAIWRLTGPIADHVKQYGGPRQASERVVCLYYIPQDPQDPESDLSANLAWYEMSKEKASV